MREADSNSHVIDGVLVLLIAFPCELLSKALVILYGLRTHSTKCGVNKGCEGASFHRYHRRVVFSHLFLLMVLVES